jgi:PAS domain S-box
MTVSSPQPCDTPIRDHSLFRTLIRTTSDGVLALDKTGLVLVYNDACTTLFGYSPEAVLGNPVAMLMAPAYKTAIIDCIAKADSKSGLMPFRCHKEVQGRRKDGSLFPMDFSLGEGMMDGERVFLAVLHDLTALHRERTAHDEERAYTALIINSANDAIISYMLDGTVTSWNRAAEKMFGYQASEIVGAKAQTLMPVFIPAEVIDAEKANFTRVLSGEAVPPHESVRLHKNGTRVPVEISASPIRDSEGRVIGITRTVRDLRERRTHEHERALLNLAISTSDDTFTCIGLDGTVLTWNRGAERMLGYLASEVVGKNALWIIGKIVPPDMIAAELENSKRAAAGERIDPYRTIRIRKDGLPVPVMSKVAAVRAEDGKILAISRTLQDLTERVVFEQQRELLSSIVESSNDAVFSKTLDGIVTSWNAAAEQMFGFSAEEIIGYPVALLIPPDRMDEETGTLQTIRDGGMLRHFETKRRRKDGTILDVSISISPLRDANRAIVGASATVRDITEKKDFEQRLQAMREDMIHVARVHEMSQVSAGIAHELNQPLAAMLNYSNAAKRLVAAGDPSALAKLPDVTAKIGDQAERAAQIIRRMRDFVEKRDPHRTEADINAIADDAMTLALIDSKSAELAIHFEHNISLPKVLVDQVQIQQVLVNLLRNAAEAMSTTEQRKLTLTISTMAEEFVEVSVSDTGTGIPAHIAAHLFAPFVTTKPDGMGIGLAISKSIIEAHGGTMKAEPNPEGGTIFRFTLPQAGQALPPPG